MQRIYFWRYHGNTRNYPGYHLSLNKEGADAIAERLRSRLSMQMERPVRFELIKPTDDVLSVPNNRNHRVRSNDQVEFVIKFHADVELLHIFETPDTVVVELSPSKVEELLDGVADLKLGRNDYAMSGKDLAGAKTCIWFW